MSWFNKLIGSGIAETVKGVGEVVDRFVETPDEKAAFKTVMAEMAQEPGLAQVELNKIGAAHRSVFVAGWRPAVGWVCAIGLGFSFLINPILQWALGQTGPELPLDIMMELVLGMLGLAGLRTVEKLSGKAK
jgi:hypothetical protein